MKGLLVKDMLLFKNQYKLILIALLIGLFNLFAAGSVMFFVVFSVAIISNSALSTISYDEAENGIAYILTKPLTRATYVKEKYAFSLLVALLNGLFTFLIAAVVNKIISKNADVMVFFAALMVGTLLSSISTPIQLKFGAQRSKIILIVVYMLFVLIIAVLKSFVPQTLLDATGSIILTAQSSLALQVFVILGVLGIIVLISYKISKIIFLKKEF